MLIDGTHIGYAFSNVVAKEDYPKAPATYDLVQYTHMEYLPIPSTWPLFTSKDKIGDWL